MSDYSRRRTSPPRRRHGTSSNPTELDSNAAALEDMPKEQVMIYLTQNSVTHHNDEIPETLAALQKADQMGLGKKSMIPISDPYKDGHKTDQYAFGETKAGAMTWWHDDSSLKPGQVRIDGRVLTLGVSGRDVEMPGSGDEKATVKDGVASTIRDDWVVALKHVGLDAGRAGSVVDTLMSASDGTARLMHSGGGAANELLQLVSVFNRAEMGEFEISSFVISGHHYSGTSYIFGEVGDHVYDDDITTGDTLDLRDIELLSRVFPIAFSQVDSMMFSACNTHKLGLEDAEGNSRSTEDWVGSTFPEASRMSNWQDIAPGSDYAAFISGEFALDVAKEEAGQSEAFNAWQFKKGSRGTNHRAELGADGQFQEISSARSKTSYPHYNDYKGLRNSNHEAFHKREDLMRYILKKL
jgi:hypothetical protein